MDKPELVAVIAGDRVTEMFEHFDAIAITLVPESDELDGMGQAGIPDNEMVIPAGDHQVVRQHYDVTTVQAASLKDGKNTLTHHRTCLVVKTEF